jgi:hypothetical protein
LKGATLGCHIGIPLGMMYWKIPPWLTGSPIPGGFTVQRHSPGDGPIIVKVKLSLCFFFFNWAPHHESILGEWRYSSTRSFISALDGGEWSASRPGHFNPRERAPGTHWIGGWVGPRAVLDAVVKRKIPRPYRESNLRTPIAHHCTFVTCSKSVETWIVLLFLPTVINHSFINVRAGNFSLHHRVQTGSGDHPSSYPMGTGGLFRWGLKRPGHEADHSPPSSAEVKNAWRYISTSSIRSHGVVLS